MESTNPKTLAENLKKLPSMNFKDGSSSLNRVGGNNTQKIQVDDHVQLSKTQSLKLTITRFFHHNLKKANLPNKVKVSNII